MHRLHLLLAIMVIGVTGSAALASPTPVTSADFSDCDTLFFPSNIADELGTTALFPPDEFIMAFSTDTNQNACPANDDTVLINKLVGITNGTNIAFSDMHYVADPPTTYSNFDGFINGQRAVRIDSFGINAPLIFESGIANDIFEPGETWQFILNDWDTTAGGAPEDLGSIGVPSSLGLGLSTGNIIGLPVPEPGMIGLMLPMLMFLRRRPDA